MSDTMAKKINCDKFRRDRATELRQLKCLIEKAIPNCDLTPIYSAQDDCRSSKPCGEISWGYSISEQLFRIDEQRHTIPENLIDLTISLSIDIKGFCLSEEDQTNPIKELAVDLVISGKNKNGERLLNCWHLDKHVPGEDEACYAHPDFHFHHGGKKMQGSFGSAIIFESPRIAHPPMDGILAVDFILSNFLQGPQKLLRDNNEYLRLVSVAQERLWKPYAIAAASHWNSNKTGWLATDIWPQLIETKR